MKKPLVILLLLLTFYPLFAIEIADVKKQVTSVMDSTKSFVKETANTVDTSRLSKQVYKDVKQALVGLAAGLKVGVEHVYRVLVVQQIVKAVVNVLVVLAFALIPLIWMKRLWAWAKEQSRASDGFSYFPAAVLNTVPGIIAAIYFCYTITETITGIVNPEYGAMQEIFTFIQNMRH